MVGIGTDIVAVARIAAVLARHRDRFLSRCFGAAEIALAVRRGRQAPAALAARWAAKEAFLKALGGTAAGISLRDIEVVHGSAGQPLLRLHRTAAAALDRAGGRRIHLSISHEKDYAVAMIVVE